MVIGVLDRDAGYYFHQHVAGVHFDERETRTNVPLEGRISEQVPSANNGPGGKARNSLQAPLPLNAARQTARLP